MINWTKNSNGIFEGREFGELVCTVRLTKKGDDIKIKNLSDYYTREEIARSWARDSIGPDEW